MRPRSKLGAGRCAAVEHCVSLVKERVCRHEGGMRVRIGRVDVGSRISKQLLKSEGHWLAAARAYPLLKPLDQASGSDDGRASPNVVRPMELESLHENARKHDVAVFQLVDPAELTFPFEDPTLFTSLEDDQKIEVNPREVRESYLEEFTAFLNQTRLACTAAGVEYTQVRTDEPLDEVLIRFLARRAGGRL